MTIENKSRFRRVAFGISKLVGAFVSTLTPLVALADSCWLFTSDQVDFVEARSEYIFIGTAIAKSTEVFEYIELDQATIIGEKTTFKVDSVKKGALEPGKTVLVEVGAKCSCAGKFVLGKKYLVYARKDTGKESLILHFCEFNKEVS